MLMETPEINLNILAKETESAVKEVIETAMLSEGDVFVIGCSSSEVCGGRIGKASNADVGKVIIKSALKVLSEKKIYLAVQSCEHINRALVVERELVELKQLEEVSVLPALNAGGACAVAGYELATNPVMVEHIVATAGIDIGDTEIGMHIKFVQVPLRLKNNRIGEARVTALKSRPKLIGGSRAVYS